MLAKQARHTHGSPLNLSPPLAAGRMGPGTREGVGPPGSVPPLPRAVRKKA